MNEHTEVVQKWDGKDGTERATLERILTPEEVKARADKKAKQEADRKAAEANRAASADEPKAS